jgi:hypothetical protein
MIEFSSRVTAHFFHPALLQLMKFQTRGKLRRVATAFTSRRKIVLSILAVLLGCVWLGQTIAAILLRESADPDKLMVWLPVSLFLYSVFHLIKIGCRKPIEPFDWTAAEKQILHAAPITRVQLVTYRLVSYFAAIAMKAACFSIVMIPDLPNILFGFVGMLIGLSLIDLVRIFLEQIAWVASQSGSKYWIRVRSAMLIPSLAFVIYAFVQTFCSAGFANVVTSPNPLDLIQYFLATVGEISNQPVIWFLMLPWKATVSVVMCDGPSASLLANLTGLFALLSAMIYLVFRTDTASDRFLNRRSSAKNVNGNIAKSLAAQSATNNHQLKKNRRIHSGLGGIRAIAWYQFKGAMHYKSALMFSLAIPTLLCCLPLLANHIGVAPIMDSTLNLIGGIVFYSFLLLPPALMLDFRRDASRLAVWKSIPIRPMSLTIGQVIVPVVLMSIFQGAVLLIAVFAGSMSAMMLLIWPLLIPMNVFIIGMENAIFLMHPTRRNQEGIEVFLRTILTFTGKGVLFAVGLALALGWAFLSIRISHLLPWKEFSGPLLFGAGVWVAMGMMAWGSLKFCARLFQRIDVSQDLPAAS